MSSVMLVVGSGLCEPVTAADQKEALVAQTMNAEESAAETNKKKPDAIVLNKVESEVENDLTLVTAKLSAQPAWKQLEVEDHGTFLQIKMPNTAIVTSGEFLDGNGPFLKKIASFQVTENDGALRLFLNQDAAKAKLATTAEILGERVVITIDHKKLEQLIQPSAPKKANSEDKLQEQAGRTPESLAPVGTKQKSKNNEIKIK